MFFIVNKTKGPISIGDIGITLGPRQAIDLDKIMKRSKSESSKSLNAAKNKGDIEIRIKDDIRRKTSDIQKVNTSSSDLDGMKESIISEMKNTMRELLQEKSGGVSKEDLREMALELLNSASKQETVIIRQDVEKIRQDEEVEMDSDLLGEINKRAVNKMVKNVENVDIKYKEEKQKDDLMNNVNELEQLLG